MEVYGRVGEKVVGEYFRSLLEEGKGKRGQGQNSYNKKGVQNWDIFGKRKDRGERERSVC